MNWFIFVAIVFAVPVLLKSYLLVAYEQLCVIAAPQVYDRLFLPLILGVIGYLIFVLEGAQSSVILANKQSSETLSEILDTIDISNSVRAGAKKILSSVLNGAAIDSFIIGRQLLIICLAFLFKLGFDHSSLTLAEIDGLSKSTCPASASIILPAYGVLDSWLFSTFLCAILVGYFFQVPSKLMAQYHPMRFFTTVPLTMYAPVVSQKVGAGSLLGVPLDALRKRGSMRHKAGQFSYLSGQKESSPVSTEQVFEALANLYGEYVTEVNITLCPESPSKQDVWFVKDHSTYEIVRPSRTFSQAIQVPEMSTLVYDVFAESSPGKDRTPPLATNDLRYEIAPVAVAGPKEVLARVYAQFESEKPSGTFIVWEMSYLTPVLSKQDGPGRIPMRIFDIHIKKPTAKVVFCVAGISCGDPVVEICPVDGVQSPSCGRIEKPNATTAKAVAVHYPSIGSRLEFRF
jgi:hypothetical protein